MPSILSQIIHAYHSDRAYVELVSVRRAGCDPHKYTARLILRDDQDNPIVKTWAVPDKASGRNELVREAMHWCRDMFDQHTAGVPRCLFRSAVFSITVGHSSYLPRCVAVAGVNARPGLGVGLRPGRLRDHDVHARTRRTRPA